MKGTPLPNVRGSAGSGRNVRPKIALALSISILGTSCAALQRLQFERPTIALEAVELTGIGAQGGSFNLWLEVYNPNEYDLRVVRTEAALQLEDTHFGSVALEESLTLPSADHARVVIPVRFTWEGIGAAARALLERGAVDYDMEATLWLSGPLNRKVTLQRRGEAPIREVFP